MMNLDALSAADRNDHTRIIEKLRNHFTPQRHVLFERFKFNSANQEPDETIKSYVVRLRRLASRCEFGHLEDSLIRDRLVIGTTDRKTRDKLLQERPVPNLLRCEQALESAEYTRQHSTFDDPKPASVNYVKGKQQSKPAKTSDKKKQDGKRPKSGKKCHWCGGASHPRDQCPAK